MNQPLTPPNPCARVCAPAQVNVLIACEESQAECKAFRARGFNAFSCDIQPCGGHHPEWHIHADVTPFLKGRVQFTTEAGVKHSVDHWHLIIAHPPCTYLCKMGAIHLVKGNVIDESRYAQMIQARCFFFECLHAKADYLAVENPLPMARAELPQPSCFIHPSWFGVKYTKKTLYWLRNLPPIFPTVTHPHPSCFVSSSRGKYRSRTFPQVAEALAFQWGNVILNDLS